MEEKDINFKISLFFIKADLLNLKNINILLLIQNF